MSIAEAHKLATPEYNNHRATPEHSGTERIVGNDERALFFEYSKAADPVRSLLIPGVPYKVFPPSLYAEGPSLVVPLDLSAELKTAGPATGPALCANFVRILKGELLVLEPVATSVVLYVLKGKGSVRQGVQTFDLAQGDFLAAPGLEDLKLSAENDMALYYVNDAPLLRYLGARPDHARFETTIYKADRANAELAKVAADPAAAHRSRVSILLGNSAFPQTRTVTQTLWAMYGTIGAGEVQKPHRHQSIALDLITDCAPGCYTLVGRELGPTGQIVDPERVDWQPGCAFVTPPGYWHAHYNTSDKVGYVIPIQDAGLQTYLRALDIRFS
jgi:gentisate 1,2-dioxygenase